MGTPWICRVDREWRRSMTWSSEWTHERGQGCAAESQSRATIENGESPTSSGIALESPIGRELRSHLVVVALSRHEIAWLRPEKVQEGETLRRACGEARRKRNESCSRNRGPESRRSYQRTKEAMSRRPRGRHEVRDGNTSIKGIYIVCEYMSCRRAHPHT